MRHTLPWTVLLGEIFLFTSTASSCGLHIATQPAAVIASPDDKTTMLDAAKNKRDMSTPKKIIAIDNVRIFNGHELLPPTTVVIDGALIGSPSSAGAPTHADERIDGTSLTLLPGLIDSHLHVDPEGADAEAHLRALASHGVTTAVNIACFSLPACLSTAHVFPDLPSLISGSAPASRPGSMHGNITAAVDPSLLVASDEPAYLDAWVARQVAAGAEVVKLVAERPGGFTQETLTRLASAARALGRRSACHAADASSYAEAHRAGVDQIHHAPLDGPVPACLARAMRLRGQVAVPTLTMMKAVLAARGPAGVDFAASAAPESVRRLREAGVTILAGTDANQQPLVPATVPFGSSLHEELELLVGMAGLSTLEALRAATSLAAGEWGLGDRGVVESGRRADLVLIEGDPLVNISATRNIRRVWIGGVEYTG